MSSVWAWDQTSVLLVSRHPLESPRICRAVQHRKSGRSEYTDSPNGQIRPIFQPFPVQTNNLSLHPSLRLSHTHQTCPFLYPETCRKRKQVRKWLVISNTYIIFQNRHLTRLELLIISADRNIWLQIKEGAAEATPNCSDQDVDIGSIRLSRLARQVSRLRTLNYPKHE